MKFGNEFWLILFHLGIHKSKIICSAQAITEKIFCTTSCACAHTFVPLAATRSIAPPIPFTILPGIIQLARSPFLDTYSNTRSIIQLERSPSHSQTLHGSSHWPGLHSWTLTVTQGQSFSKVGPLPLHHLPRDHPVGQVSILGHLQQN